MSTAAAIDHKVNEERRARALPLTLPAQRMQIAGVQLFAAVADDLIARDIEHIDAPVKFGREQIGGHAEQLIRTAIGPFGDASAGADIPVSVGLAVNGQDLLPPRRFPAYRSFVTTVSHNAVTHL